MGAAFNRRSSPERPFRDLVARDLKPKSYRPVYVLVGEDPYRFESVVEHIRDDMLGPQGAAFNYHVRHGDQCDLQEVLQLCNSFPMLGDRQLIWLKKGDQALKGKAGDEARFLKYLENPVAATVLILSADKLDGRKKWVKACRASRCTFDCSAPKGEELRSWVRKAARKASLVLDGHMLELLVDHVGEDLHALQAEIQKLAMLCEDDPDLDAENAAEVVMKRRYEGPFELVASLKPGDPLEALTRWHQLKIWGHRPEEVVPLLSWRIRKMGLLNSLVEAGIPQDEFAELSGMSPFVYKRLMPAVHAFGRIGIRRALEASQKCDRALKSSAVRSDMAVEKAIIEICGTNG